LKILIIIIIVTFNGPSCNTACFLFYIFLSFFSWFFESCVERESLKAGEIQKKDLKEAISLRKKKLKKKTVSSLPFRPSLPKSPPMPSTEMPTHHIHTDFFLSCVFLQTHTHICEHVDFSLPLALFLCFCSFSLAY